MSDRSEEVVTVELPPVPTKSGQAFIFVFPFGVDRSAGAIPPLLVRLGDITCRVWPPHVNRENLDPGEPVDYERIPSTPGARAATQSLLRLNLQRIIPEAEDRAIATAMRVDVYGVGSAEAFRDAATAIVDRFLRLCRLWLRQWWISRGPDDIFGNCRISFEVDASGTPVSESTQSEAAIRPRLGSEAKLTNENFRLIWAALSLGSDSPFSATALFDSFYFSAFGENERAILDVAIACEALLREEAHKRLAEVEARKAVPSQPLSTIVKVTRKVFGKAIDDDELISGLRRMQVVRNAIAHGNVEEVYQLPEISDPAALWKVQFAACNLFRWAATVIRRSFPDPILAFERPFGPRDSA